MAQILFKNANLLDPHADSLQGGVSVLVEGESIREVSARSIQAGTADVIDCKGRTLMPGLIDCHVHVMLSEVNIRYLEAIPLTMMTVRAAALMRAMIDGGFTTVRDTGGADWGVRDGVAQGLLPGPRMFIAGRAIGPTGGHSAALMKEKGAYLVANLVAYYAMKERAKEFGMTAEMLAKNDLVIDGGLKSLEICKRAGVPVGYGSDLLGQLQVDQSREFLLRREVLSPIEIIRQATLVGAEILRMPGKLGVVKPGAFADILVVDGDPIKNLELLSGQGENMSVIMKAGRFHKNRLAA